MKKEINPRRECDVCGGHARVDQLKCAIHMTPKERENSFSRRMLAEVTPILAEIGISVVKKKKAK